MQRETGTFTVKSGLAEMLKGGVIMDVTTAEQAKIAEDAGACAVMALERVPADIRRDGGVARMADATKVEEIQQAVSIPVMAKARIGHFVEAQILQSLGVDYIDESEVLTPADEEYHIDKWAFTVPFVCGARDLGEALRRIAEGAAMIRTKGEAGTGNVVEAVRHQRAMLRQIAEVTQLRPEQYVAKAKELGAPVDLVRMVAEQGKLPVVNFAAGGLATPADAALMMQLGVDGVFVGSGIYKSEDPAPGDPGEGLPRARGADAGTRDRLARDPAPRSRLVGSGPLKVGVLALQGDFREHVRVLATAGAVPVEIRTVAELADVDRLVIPGGESTTIAKLAHAGDLVDPLRERARDGMPILGTCAGMIVMAERVLDGEPLLSLMDVTVRRNAYGRQVDSFEADVDVDGIDHPVRGVFIRAPWIEDVGSDVNVLSSYEDRPVVLQQGSLLAASFHPELVGETALHEYFLSLPR